MVSRNSAKHARQRIALAAAVATLSFGAVESVRAATHDRSSTPAQNLIYSSWDCPALPVRCNYEIFTLKLDGSPPAYHLDAPATDDTYATYSPNGSEIAYISWDTQIGCDSHVWLMDADGSNPHMISSPVNAWDEGLGWAPNGQIVFTRWPNGPTCDYGAGPGGTGPEGHGDLYLLSRWGGLWSEEPLLTRPGSEFAPAYSPTGHRIAYSYDPDDDGIYSEGEPGDKDIWTSRVDGTGHKRLTHTRSVTEEFPAWSPDGRRIAFARGEIAGDVFPRGHAQIWLMRADGTNKKRLTPPGYLDVHPAWSPDGKRIAFTRCIDKPDFFYDCSLAIVALRSLQRVRIVLDRGFEIMPKWVTSTAG